MTRRTKNYYFSFLLLLLVLLLAGCGGGSDEESDSTESDNASQSEEQANEADENESDVEEESETATTEADDDSNDTSSTKEIGNQDKESNSEDREEKGKSLSNYSSEEIEYARVWLELGPNQEIDELNVRHIAAGEPINPNDETSANYPEDVIQLAGSRLVDGSVTYSGNGDGTINVYNVPLRWDSSDAEVDEDFMKEYTESLIEETELVKIDPGNDEEIIKLIDIMKIH
ncbi:hypothetical protein [Oceanobacillus manasiensis]|uniref:hypothetical protein n=1 Tax=Oceanobacillus manasiensis TaxID=586413 RepID=UPI0005AA7840|nr:hypothetical protein [Oceanobacillus manasiensis]